MRKLLTLLLVTNFAVQMFAQEIDQAKKETAYKIINLIKDKEYEKIKEAFPPDIASNIPDNTLKYYIDMGAVFINEYGIPKDEALISKVKFMQLKEGPVQIYSIIFPFPPSQKRSLIPERIIEIGFMDKYGNDKITNIQVAELKAVEIIEQQPIKSTTKKKKKIND